MFIVRRFVLLSIYIYISVFLSVCLHFTYLYTINGLSFFIYFNSWLSIFRYFKRIFSLFKYTFHEWMPKCLNFLKILLSNAAFELQHFKFTAAFWWIFHDIRIVKKTLECDVTWCNQCKLVLCNCFSAHMPTEFLVFSILLNTIIEHSAVVQTVQFYCQFWITIVILLHVWNIFNIAVCRCFHVIQIALE